MAAARKKSPRTKAASAKHGAKAPKPRAAASQGRSKQRAPSAADVSRTDAEVEAFVRELDHPRKRELAAVRELVLAASPDIREGIKWNAPSFRTSEYFGTFHLRAKDGRLWLILHLGAKVKATAKTGIEVADPDGVLNWLAKDRAAVTFSDSKDVRAKGAALQAVIREWIRWV